MLYRSCQCKKQDTRLFKVEKYVQLMQQESKYRQQDVLLFPFLSHSNKNSVDDISEFTRLDITCTPINNSLKSNEVTVCKENLVQEKD